MRKLRAVWAQSPPRLLSYLLDPVWFYALLGTYEDEPIVWDKWQVSHLRDYSRVRFREKSPQIGFSWMCAAEAVWESIMFEDVASGFISVDQREAQNKILYARKLYDGLPKFVQEWVPIVRDSMEALDFGSTARPSQLVSLPATAGMRGRNMSVYLDECDFYKDGGISAYRAAIGRISRGGGRVTGGSTCMGVDTLLDQQMQGVNTVSTVKVSIARFPYTVVENPEQMEAIMLAKETLDPEDFAEEYECVRAGSSAAPFAPEMVRAATHDNDYGVEVDVDSDRIRRLVLPDPRMPLVCGYDVGKGTGKHPSVASIHGRFPEGWMQMITHSPMKRNGDALTLPEQEAWLVEMMSRCPQMILIPDAQGVGAQIAQALVKRFGTKRVLPMIAGSKPKGLKPQDKAEMITDMKRAMEAGEFWLMQDKEQFQQFVRTRKQSGNYVQAGATRRSHFDRFWACAYAQWGIAASRSLESAYSRRGLVVIDMGGQGAA